MKNVYILTKEGKEFSKEGCELIKDMIIVNFKETDELVFSMGDVYNKPEHLKSVLAKNPDSYLAVSDKKNTASSVTVICGDNIKATISLLNDFPNQRSWDSVTNELQKIHTED